MSVGRSRTAGEKGKGWRAPRATLAVPIPPQLSPSASSFPSSFAPQGRILLAQPAAYCRNKLVISDQDALNLVSCLRGILFSRKRSFNFFLSSFFFFFSSSFFSREMMRLARSRKFRGTFLTKLLSNFSLSSFTESVLALNFERYKNWGEGWRGGNDFFFPFFFVYRALIMNNQRCNYREV